MQFALISRLTSHASSRGISSLYHEGFDDTMECVIVVVAVPGMSHKIFHCFGALVREKVNVDVTQHSMDASFMGNLRSTTAAA